jgi:hypothetical protein
MDRAIKWAILMNCGGWLALGQSPEPAPRFEIADVHVSAKTVNPFVRSTPVRGGRYLGGGKHISFLVEARHSGG